MLPATGSLRYILLTFAGLLLCAQATRGNLQADIRLENRTGTDKVDWPIVLTVYKLFGANLDLEAIQRDGFHVYDTAGNEVPHMVRAIPPAFSIGNDEIVFLVPEMRAGESLRFRVTNTKSRGRTQPIDLAGNPNNLLRGRFTTDGQGKLAGYELTSGKGVGVTADVEASRSGKPCIRLTVPVGSTVSLRSEKPVQFRKDGQYHFSLWAKTDNVAYTGWGFWGDGGTIAFEPAAIRGRDSIALRGTREWYCYTFDATNRDDWGMPAMAYAAQAAVVKKGRKDVPAEIWEKDGLAHLAIRLRQADQPFLNGDKTGTTWLDEVVLLEQPTVTVDRAAPLRSVAREGAIVFARPVNMPRMGACAHEAVDRIETFAMPGERRQLRLGIHAVEDLRDIRVEVPPLTSGDGKAKPLPVEIELLAEYVDAYEPIASLPAGRTTEFLLSVDVPTEASPGDYRARIVFASGEKMLAEVPLRLEVLPCSAPDMKPYLVGGIYNTGMGLTRDRALYECYAKTGFNYLLLFDYLFPPQGGKLDYRAAREQVEEITHIAGVRDAIGLYRECNMSEDQPRLWYQIAAGKPEYAGPYKIGTDSRYEQGYVDLARKADAFAKQNGWPQLVYMVSDEPGDKRDVDPSMGWLQAAIPDTLTIADVQFKDMVRTWQWYSLPILDDPIDWTGPLVYEWIRAQGRPFGFCGTGWSLEVARYQPGLMLAASGGIYWHFWHLRGPFEPRDSRVVRSHAVAAMAEGLNDLRYYVLLKQQIDKAEQRLREGKLSSFGGGRLTAKILVAKRWLNFGFDFATADHDRHLMPYNGVPETWGYDRFYDEWRAGMKEFILQLLP
jgi:hypothetical protein